MIYKYIVTIINRLQLIYYVATRRNCFPNQQFCFLFLLFFICSCDNHKDTNFATRTNIPIFDLTNIKQDVSLIKNFKLKASQRNKNIKDLYFTEYFKAWTNNFEVIKPKINQNKMLKSECYDETLKPCNIIRLRQILHNTNIENAGIINQYGVITRNTNLRTLPTNFPWFNNPLIAGEGYPFDNLQIDMLYIGRPVFVSHFSKDKSFVYIQIPYYASGWVESANIVLLTQEQANKWRQSKIAIIKKENIPLIDKDGNFIEYAKIGTHLPIIKHEGEQITLAAPYKNERSALSLIPVKLNNDCCIINSTTFNHQIISDLIQDLINKPYGWGTYLGNRDCSALVKDFYSIFHIWMPRNSYSQYSWFNKANIQNAKTINLKGKTIEEKEEIIKTQAIPFQTILFHPGHIAIYSGIYQNQIIIFHSIWGNKTFYNNEFGRNVIGTSAFTTLEFGKELIWRDKEETKTSLERLEGMVIIEM